MFNKNLDEKKRKLIVVIITAVIIVASVVSIVFAVYGKNGKYVDTPVSDMNNTSQNISDESENTVLENNSQDKNATTQETEKTTEDTTQQTTEKTTIKPKLRYAYITVQLPIGNSAEDTLELLINGKVVAKEDVKIDGSSVTIATKEKYKGDIEVVARLVNYNTSASSKLLAGDNSKTLVIPLNGLEEGFGNDE